MIDQETLSLLSSPEVRWTVTLVAFVYGAVVGSYLNVVMYRLPRDMSTVTPRSACPNCDTQIKSYDNIPVISYLVLRGRCRSCKAKFSASYAYVEFFTGFLVSALTYAFWPSAILIPLLVFAGFGVAMFGIDAATFRLPRKLTAPLWLLVPVLTTLAMFIDGTENKTEIIVRMLLAGVAWFSVFFVPWLYTGGKKMGFGDVLLSFPVGLMLGYFSWATVITGFFAAFGVATIIMLIIMIKSNATRKTAVPFGPFILAGGLYGVLTQGTLWETYLQVIGL